MPGFQMNSDRIQDALYGFTRSQILFAAVELNVFSHIAEGHQSLDSLIAATHTDRRGLRILLDGLVGIGLLNKKDVLTYVLSEDAERFLVKSSSEYMGGMVTHGKRLYENWMLLTDAVRSGQPVGGAQSMAQLEKYFAELVKGLYVSNYPSACKLADKLGIGTTLNQLEILDVAGGSGVWSLAMLEKDKASRATLLDFPTVVHVAEEYVNQHGFADRYSYWPEDLEEAEFPEPKYDLAILANICHALGPIATERLLASLAAGMKPGGQVAIIDFVPDDARSRPGWPLVFGVNMLITTVEGDVFSEGQYAEWFKKAGFSSVERHELEDDVALILAKK